jgi:hypothetical protein
VASGGVIGSSQSFYGTAAMISTQNQIAFSTNPWSWEFWYKSNLAALQHIIFTRNTLDSINYCCIDIQTVSSKWRIRNYLNNAGTSGYYYTNTLANAADGAWRHVMVVRDNTAAKIHIYINGDYDSTQGSALVTSYSVSTRNPKIGRDPAGTLSPLVGNLDELRLSNVVRNGGWAEMSYSSQALNKKFVSYFAEEAYPTTPAAPNISELYLKSGFYNNEQFSNSVFYNNEQALDTTRY